MKLFAAFLLPAALAFAQLSPTADWATHFANNYRVAPNVTYLTAGGVDLKLDVYARRNVTTPQPTLLYMHGGFWVAGNKEGALPILMPWMEMGWNVVNVEYRLGPVAQRSVGHDPGQATAGEGAEHVVDAGPRDVREPGHLGRRRTLAAEQRQVGRALVPSQADLLQRCLMGGDGRGVVVGHDGHGSGIGATL